MEQSFPYLYFIRACCVLSCYFACDNKDPTSNAQTINTTYFNYLAYYFVNKLF